ncbi:hypothetical protein GGS21DRAFT_192317 [Xylaria nigripes]|nr:hypothetical protein GGS21DRAFT_192317 [Xylaria nigripes]
MSAPIPSSSDPPRTPLHEGTNPRNDKHQIRLVTNTPSSADTEKTVLHSPISEDAGNDTAVHATDAPISDASTSLPPAFSTWPRTKGAPGAISGNGKQQIRLVTDTLSSVETEKNVLHIPISEDAENESAAHTTNAPASGASTPLSPVFSTWPRTKGVSESRLISDLSGPERPERPVAPSLASHITSNASSIRLVNAPGQPDNASGSGSVRAKPPTRRNRVLSINSDKTFSVILKPTPKSTPGPVPVESQSTLKSYPFSNNSMRSHEETSFAPTDDHPSSVFSRLPARSPSISSSEPPTIISALNEDHTASLLNFRMVGGLRQVPKTADPNDKGKGKEIATEPLPTLPEAVATESILETLSLAPKASFLTEDSTSTLEETANYKIIGRSSPPQAPSDKADDSPSSSSANYQLIGHSSAPHSFSSTPGNEQSVPGTPESKNFIVHDSPYPVSELISLETPRSKNFVVHHNTSPSPRIQPTRAIRNPPSYDSFRQHVRERYSQDSFSQASFSQDSLIIPPLRPHRRSGSENLHLRQISESPHRRSNSYSSISSVLTHETGPNVVLLPPFASASLPRQPTWGGRKAVGRPVSRLDVHQRSSQLTPVMSEYEDSERDFHLSRITSLGSSVEFSSTIGHPGIIQSRSRSGSLDRPTAVIRNGREFPSLIPTVRDHDEHGDGLADLQEMQQLQTKSSRSRLGFLSRQSSDKSLRSTISSRSGSFSSGSIPTWAKLYYGSGERRWLAPRSAISLDDDREPITSWTPEGTSPSQSQQDLSIPPQQPRRSRRNSPLANSPEITPVVTAEIPQNPKKKTSSIWSPHLGLDRRLSPYDMWHPPKITWSADNSTFGRRNIQVMLFVLGFVFLFAWMTAAMLPLPPKPNLDVEASEKNTTLHQIPEETQPSRRPVVPNEESLYQSARWWRSINRYMSIIGVFILGAIIALSVIGVRQGWGQ